MTNQNELQVNTQTGEILDTSNIVQETADYTIIKLPDGKFKKEMKYKRIFTKIPETKEEQVLMYRVFNDENNQDLVTSLSNMVGDIITIDQLYTNPYASFNEKTGASENGVVTTIQDGDSFYATSSKSVYYTLLNMFEVFGTPNTLDYEPIKVIVTAKKLTNGTQINLSLA